MSTVVPSSRTNKVRSSPYVGLMPFTEQDAEYFAGREQEAKVVFSNLCAAQLTVFFGPSGVGKSSLLDSGVVPLVRQSRACGTVVCFRGWQQPNFYAELKLACVRAAKQSRPEISANPKQPLDCLLSELARALRRPVFVLLDQFEEYLLFHADVSECKDFEAELASAINDDRVPAHFLIGIREDSLSKLDHLDMRIPNLLGNTLRLRPISREGAEAALRVPLAKYNQDYRKGLPLISIDDDLVNEVLTSTSTDKTRFSDTGEGSGKSVPPGKPGAVDLGYLQLVMTRVWETELTLGSNALRRSTLVNKLGGTAAVVRTHLDRLMRAFTDREQQACARMFNVLVTSSGNKITYTAPELVEHSDLPLEELSQLLDKLTRVGVLREVDSAEVGDDAVSNAERRFEIQHDRLAVAVLDWRRRYVIERQIEREQADLKRTMWRGLGAALLCAVVAGGLAFLSYRERKLNAATSALREMRALVIAPRLLDAASAARVKAATAIVAPRGALTRTDPDEDLAKRLLHQANELYQTEIPAYLDENIKKRVEQPAALRGSSWYLGFQSISTISFSSDSSVIAIGTDDGLAAFVPRNSDRDPLFVPSQTEGFLALGFRSPSEPVGVRRGLPGSKLRADDSIVAQESSGDGRESLTLAQFKVDAKSGSGAVLLDNQARSILVFGADGRLRIQDLQQARDIWVSPTPDGEVSSAHLVSHGRQVRLGYATIAGQLKTVSIEGIKVTPTERSVHAMGRTLVALASASSEFAFATASGHDVSWWPRVDATGAVPLVSGAQAPASVRKLAVSADAKRVAALREGGLVSVWNVETTPELIFEYDFAFPQFEAAFSSDLSQIAIFVNRGLLVFPLQKQSAAAVQARQGATLHADEYLLAVGDIVPALRQGVTAAGAGKFADAVGAFRQAFEFPGIKFDPRAESLRQRMLVIGQALMKEVLAGKDVAEIERLLSEEEQKSGNEAAALKNLEYLVDPVMAQAYLARAVRRLLEPKQIEATDPKFRTYLQVYSDLSRVEELNPAATVPAVYWNNLCWFGTLVGHSRQLVDAGERAVRLAPTDATVRDTRGVSRALSGNLAGAVADFRFLVQDASIRNQLSKPAFEQRLKWLDELSNGRNPFNKQVLQQLRDE